MTLPFKSAFAVPAAPSAMPDRSTEESVQPRALDEESLVAAMREVVTELHPHLGRGTRITIDSSLDRDLGLDSLSRMELLARLERAFGVRIPEAVMANAETARELLPALQAGRRRERTVASVRSREAEVGAVEAIPAGASTLLEAVDFHARRHGDRVHVELYGPGADPERLTFSSLVERAEYIAAGLANRGLAPGQAAALMLPTGVDYLATFLAVQMAGAIPVPIYPPARLGQLEDHVNRHAGILANASARMLVTFAPALGVSRLLTGQVRGLDSVVDVAALDREGRLGERPALDGSSTAFLQYTSGSTGSPKGVVLSHGDVLASLEAMAAALGATPRDVFVSWLPLYHDMGLIGAWMGSLYYGFPLVLMSPLDFLARPVRWLEAIHRHRGSLSGGPSFAYELCVRRIEPEEAERLDLSSWRLAFNGAEPVNPDTMDRFAAKFAPCGFPPNAMTPVYGLAEATLGVAFTPLGRGPRVEAVDADAITRRARAVPRASGPPEHIRRFVSCGPPIPGFEVRIVDGGGTELEERAEGAIEFRGPSATAGYFRNPAATGALFDADWLRTGDRGYIAGGELYVTGRDKDLIIRAGRNIYPYDLEAAVGEVEGVRKGCVAVFASVDPGAGTERLVVVAETREEGSRPAPDDRRCNHPDRGGRARRGPRRGRARAAAYRAQDVEWEDPAVRGPRAVRERSAPARRRIGAHADCPARARRGRRAGALVGARGVARRLRDPRRVGRGCHARPCLAGRRPPARERARAMAPRAVARSRRVHGVRHPNPVERRVEPRGHRAVRAGRQSCKLPRRSAALRGDAGPGRLCGQGRAGTQLVPRPAPARPRSGVRPPAGPRAQRGGRRGAREAAGGRERAGLLPRGYAAPHAGTPAVPARRVLRRRGGGRRHHPGHHRRLALGAARRPPDPAPGEGLHPDRAADRSAGHAGSGGAARFGRGGAGRVALGAGGEDA